ncbi:deoxyribonuclease TATDN2 [Pelobates cultripes]|uniref:Deoxyribonuclease TATDN2 n=2 Tax=Pelobates cultripes TaxID=61616 RepID=A0AAD1SUL4_PELCU|nr:deoxyribonuclease TATDN2 [Pelobates cultripes]
MAASDGKTRKHKWSSPTEMSPNKYLKGTETRLPRRVSYTKAHESETVNVTQNRHVTLYECETDARNSPSSKTLDDETIYSSPATAKGKLRRRQRSDPSTCDTTQLDTSADLVTGHSDAFRREVRTHETENRDDTTLHKDGPSFRKPRAHDPSMIFKKAFQDIIGTPVRSKRTSNEHKSSSDKEHQRGSDECDLKVFVPGAGIAKKSEHHSDEDDVQKEAPERLSDSSDVVTELPNKSEANVHEETQRLVFLYDDSDEDTNTGGVVEKDPSIGSDFSDVEDVHSLARFSQEDPIPSCCSIPKAYSGTSSSYVMYPPYLYKSPWCNYTDQWTSSPVYKPCTEQDIWRQEESNGSLISDHCTDWLEKSSLSVSSDRESPEHLQRQRSGSFHSPLTHKNTNLTQRRKSDSFVLSDFSTNPTSFKDGFIDTHCHLDMLFGKLSFKGSFAEFRRAYNTSFPVEFQGCIADFCDPDTLHNLQWQDLLEEDMVWGAFGCHPHFAQYFTNQQQEEIMKALRHPKAVAYGEMGLDYSHKCSTKIPVQQKVFEDQLKLAVSLGKPLVIHCRDADEDLFRIMKKLVPSDYKFHRHCFTGPYSQIEPFLNEFPNMAVGFTALVTYHSATDAKDAMKRIPLERLLVETDAPYFLPRQVPKGVCKFAHPGLALHTIQEIAKLRNISVKSVLSALRKNTNQLYSI